MLSAWIISVAIATGTVSKEGSRDLTLWLMKTSWQIIAAITLDNVCQ